GGANRRGGARRAMLPLGAPVSRFAGGKRTVVHCATRGRCRHAPLRLRAHALFFGEQLIGVGCRRRKRLAVAKSTRGPPSGLPLKKTNRMLKMFLSKLKYLLTVCLILSSVSAFGGPVLRLSGIPDENPTELQRKFQPMVDRLQRDLGMKVEY